VQKDYSPFAPGQPIAPEFFVGRAQQVQILINRVQRSLSNRIEVVFVSGERGIGKTSLARFVHRYAEQHMDVVGTHVHLGGVQDINEAIRRTIERILQESAGKPWHQRLLSPVRKYVREIGVLGVTIAFHPPPDQLQGMAQYFPQEIQRILSIIHESHALLIIWDDINGLAQQESFALWFKSFVDETARRRVPLCFVMIGLEELRRMMIRNNESLARVFYPLEIPLWNEEECREFFQQAFQRVNTRVEKHALDMMVAFSGGHPALAHEIGDAVFLTDKDGVIDLEDAVQGIRSAAEIVGRKYLDPQVLSALRSQRYRSILHKLATIDFGFRFYRSEVLRHLSEGEKRVFDNFLRRMRNLGVIRTARERGRGAYEFVNILHYLYFSMEAKAQRPG